jgi:hypothetical protein
MWKYIKRLNEQHSNYNLKLALILAIYLILAIFYSVVVPIGRGADEWAHYSMLVHAQIGLFTITKERRLQIRLASTLSLERGCPYRLGPN